MIARKPRTALAGTRRPHRVMHKPTRLGQRMEALQEAEDARQVFVQCSGMHTPRIQWIIHQICFRTRWVTTPGTCAEFVVPALTNGIPQHWENVVAAQAEIAVYAALFMSLHVHMFLGGLAPANSTEEHDSWNNLRHSAYFGFMVGSSLGTFNIICGVVYRLVGAYLPRESDKLAVLWTYRWIPPLNFVLFGIGMLVGLSYGLATGHAMMFRGGFCMPDGSLTYEHWYLQWVRESYPKGKGLLHPLNESLLNPWALAADAAGIERPDAKYTPSTDIGTLSTEPHHASFQAYEEFMADHLGLQGGGCFGGRVRTLRVLMALPLVLIPILASRSPMFYWFRVWRTKGKAGCTDNNNAADPYDLSAIYEEFKVRAAIGQEMADKDPNRDGFVTPEAEGAYVLSSSKNILGGVSAPTPIALDAPVLAALQQAAVDPERLRQYAEDVSLHPFLNTVLERAGVADLGTRLKAIEALRGVEEDGGAGTGDAPRETVKPNHQVPPAKARV